MKGGWLVAGVFWGSARDWTQGLVYAKYVVHHWVPAPAPPPLGGTVEGQSQSSSGTQCTIYTGVPGGEARECLWVVTSLELMSPVLLPFAVQCLWGDDPRGHGVGNKWTGGSENISAEFLSLLMSHLCFYCDVFIVSSLVVRERTPKERQTEYGACGVQWLSDSQFFHFMSGL